MSPDGPWLYFAIATYFAAAGVAIWQVRRGNRMVNAGVMFLAAALALHAIAIIARWQRLDHGPYVNLFEILSSNVWSLHFGVLVAVLAIPRIRPVLAAVLPLLQVLTLWLAVTPAADAAAPVTYQTAWLAVHVWVGKVFLATLVVAVGLGLVILLRTGAAGRDFAVMPPSVALEELAYRFVLGSFVFETAMLVAGAIWAQDAWGRYWAWDPLETWAFVTWMAAAGYLHARATYTLSPAVRAVMILAVFFLAFSTFFGMPFVSTAPHKGAV